MMVLVATALAALAATSLPVQPTRPAVAPRAYASPEALRHYALGRLLEERGESEAAVAEYYRALTLDSHSTVIARSISELRSQVGDARGSLEFAERALGEDPADARSLWLKGAALFNLGSPEPALVALEAATRADSLKIEYFRTVARVAEQLERLEVVEAAYRRVTILDEYDSESWFQLAAVKARLGRFEDADSALAISIRLNPVRPGVVFLQGWIDESLGHDVRAIDLYRRHLGLHPGDQAARRRLVNLLARARRYEEAYLEAQLVTKSRVDDSHSLEVEADLAYYARRAAEGQKVIQTLLRLYPDDPGIAERVIGLLARHHRDAEVEAVAVGWISRHPGDPDGPMLAAHAAMVAGRFSAAIEHSRHAVALAPDSLGPMMLLGRAYQGARRWTEAESVWAVTARQFPGLASATLGLALCREQLGDLPGAEQAAREALTRETENPTALNFLGYLLADHGRNLEEAENLIRRAVEQEPDNGAFIDSQGWVYFRLGRLKEARSALERAVALTGGDPIVHEHLGDVYKQLRFMDLAREQYRLSLAGDAKNARVREKLQEAR